MNRNGDFWRMHLDDGEKREIDVCSSRQTPTGIKKDKEKTTVSYHGVVAESGVFYNILLTVFIKNMEGALCFSADIENWKENYAQWPIFSYDYPEMVEDLVETCCPLVRHEIEVGGIGYRRKYPQNAVI